MSDDSESGEWPLRYIPVSVPHGAGQRTSSRRVMWSCLGSSGVLPREHVPGVGSAWSPTK